LLCDFVRYRVDASDGLRQSVVTSSERPDNFGKDGPPFGGYRMRGIVILHSADPWEILMRHE
jgi:hypothetical protein